MSLNQCTMMPPNTFTISSEGVSIVESKLFWFSFFFFRKKKRLNVSPLECFKALDDILDVKPEEMHLSKTHKRR